MERPYHHSKTCEVTKSTRSVSTFVEVSTKNKHVDQVPRSLSFRKFKCCLPHPRSSIVYVQFFRHESLLLPRKGNGHQTNTDIRQKRWYWLWDRSGKQTGSSSGRIRRDTILYYNSVKRTETWLIVDMIWESNGISSKSIQSTIYLRSCRSYGWSDWWFVRWEACRGRRHLITRKWWEETRLSVALLWKKSRA
jgi:hypothetical protein